MPLRYRLPGEGIHDDGGAADLVGGKEGAHVVAPVVTEGGFWLPIEDSETVAVGLPAGLTNDVGEQATALFGLRYLDAYFGDEGGLAKGVEDVSDVGDALVDGVLGTAYLVGVPLDGCQGIERHAYEVVIDGVVAQDAQVPVVEPLVEAVVEVDDGLCLREHGLDRLAASLDESCVLLGMLLSTPHGPEEAIGCLVTHLYPFGADAACAQVGQHFGGVASHVVEHFLVPVFSPSLGDVLFAGVGPVVAVVKVYHDVHAQATGPKRLFEDVLLRTEAVAGIYPYTETDGVEAEVFHQSRTLHRVALSGGEAETAFLEFGRPADVGAEGEVLLRVFRRFTCAQRECNEGEAKCFSGVLFHVSGLCSLDCFLEAKIRESIDLQKKSKQIFCLAKGNDYICGANL